MKKVKKIRNLKKRLDRAVELDKINNQTRLQDVAWISSLSHSQMDFLISLKLLITQRAERIGCKNLADRFDLKTIRAIAFALMENLKAEVKDSSLIQDGTVKSTAFLDACNILHCTNEVSATIEELSTNVGADIQQILRSSPTRKRKRQKIGSRAELQRIKNFPLLGGPEISNLLSS